MKKVQLKQAEPALHTQKQTFMTHVKNAEVFARLVDFCTGYGGTYNPGRPTLHINALLAQKQEANAALTQVISAKSLYDNEVNQRRQVFDQLPRLAASVMRTLEASGATTEKLDDARQFVRMITGSSPKNRPPVSSAEAQPSPQARAVLQLAYVSKADSFAKLVSAVAAEPLYQTNEPHLAVAGLTNKVNQLRTLNERVSLARVAWSNTRIERNNVLYNQSRSLFQTARAVKKYVRAIYGPDSEQYGQVRDLSFIKPGT